MPTSPVSDAVSLGFDDGPIEVLLVDDDEPTVEMSATFLQRELSDVVVDTRVDPEAAVEAVTTAEYDCVVSDYDMPGCDGLELLERIRESGVDVPFVLFTGKGSEEIASRAISAGVNEYLQKGGPEQYAVLANRVETLVEKHRAESWVRQGFLAIESAQEGIGIIDADGVYQYVNEAYADVYDRDRTELVGEHWEVLYPDAEVERFEEEILPELESVGTWRGLSTGITEGGREVSERLVLTQMDDGGHVCIVRDVTEEDRVREELAAKTRALEAVPVGVAISDPTLEDNPLVYVNGAFERLTGYDTDEAVGRNCRFLQGEETDPADVAALRSAIDEARPATVEILNYDADGDTFQNVVEVIPVEGEDGSVDHFVGVQHETGPTEDSEVAVEGRLAWLSEFSNVLSHDLKTPLSVIRGNIELAQESGDLDRLVDADRAVQRLEALIDDLSTVMKEGSLVNDVGVVDLASVFRSRDEFEAVTESLAVVDTRQVLADERALGRLADNLVKNSVEHGGEGVSIRIGTLPDGFYYEDDGPGIPPERREEIFTPGFTTKGDEAGFGMVSIRQIAVAHGWTVSVAASEEGGARFEFTDVDTP